MENESINLKIIKVWNDYPTESGKYLPILYPKFNQGRILFIGLNPSFSDKVFKKILKGTKYEGINIKEKLNRKNKDYDFLIWLESRAANEKDACDYFAKFHNISESVKLPYHHIDLFYFREKTQKETKKRIGVFNKKKEFLLNDFALSQLRIAKEIINEINPRIIIVANAFASDIINKHDLFKIDKSKFEVNGYDFLEINHNKIPIIFSSMLTGRRALDNHSFRRLKWIINKAIKS